MDVFSSAVNIVALIKIIEKYGAPAVEEAFGIQPQVAVTVEEIEAMMGVIKKPEAYFKGVNNEET